MHRPHGTVQIEIGACPRSGRGGGPGLTTTQIMNQTNIHQRVALRQGQRPTRPIIGVRRGRRRLALRLPLLLVLLAHPAAAVTGSDPPSAVIEPPPAAPGRIATWRPDPVEARRISPDADRTPIPVRGARRLQSPAVGTHPLVERSRESTRLLAATPAWLARVDAGELSPVDLIVTDHLTYARFRQMIDERPVLGSSAIFQWDAAGRLVLARGRWHPSARAQKQSIRADELLDLSAARLASLRDWPDRSKERADDSDVAWEEEEPAWFPARDSSRPDSLQLVPVWRLRFTTATPEGRWEALVDARDGEILARTSLLRHAEVTGRITALVEPSTVGETPVVVATPRADVRATAGSYLTQDTTAADGTFRLETPTGERARIATELRGAFAWVRDASRGLYTPLDTATVRSPATADFRWDESNSSFAARDAYHHVVRAHDFIRSLDAGPALASLDQPIQVRVDDAGGSCNAWWNGTRLNFYAEGSGCVASARIADVVFHEYGHAVTDRCYAPFSPPGDMGEAFSDYFATTLTNQPGIGLGFYGPGSRIRDVERDRVWPRDASPSIHLQGLILAGALWDLRKELGAAVTDPLFHYPRYAAAQSFDEYLMDLLAWDDDNGDLDDGTPHFNAIIAAFRRHGIGDYQVRIEHEALPDTEDPGLWLEAQARVTSLLPLAADSVVFHYSTGGPFQHVRPETAGGPRQFRVVVATPPDETTLRYYWTAADTAGHRSALPAEGAAAPFSFHVGADRLPPSIEHDSLSAITADRARLSLHARIRDNSGRIGDASVWVEQNGTGDTTRAELLPWSGDGMRRGELYLPPLAPGDTLSYRITASDLARAPNAGGWPATGAHRIAVHEGRHLDFETLPEDMSTESGWEWGVPALGPSAWSGERLWATTLDGPHEDNLSASLLWGPINLRSWDRARLEFLHWYRCEEGFDGARVEWAFEPEGPWFLLVPEGGYSSSLVRALDGPGFTGDGGAWSPVRIPLDRLAGRRGWLQFRFESDARVRDLGWYLDDVTLLRSQALLPPERLRAVECGADCLELTWSLPAGIDTTATRFLGYLLERTRAENPSSFFPVHGGLLRATRWRDAGLETGVTYRYRLTARWDEGASAGREVEAAPYAPALGLPFETVVYEMNGFAAGDTTFMVENLTGGTLRFNTYLGEDGAEIDAARLLFRRGLGEAWAQLWTREADSTLAVDLIAVDARERDDAEIGPVLEIRLRGDRPWGDPRHDWGGLIWIDTDDNLSTGRRDLNMAAEYLVAFGSLASEAGHDGPAVLLNDLMQPIIGLTGAVLPAGADSLLLAVPWGLISDPSEVRLQVTLHSTLQGTPFERAPALPEIPWLSREPRHGHAAPGDAQPCELSFDASSVGNGSWAGTLFLESNDAGRPVRAISVRLDASGIIPRDVDDLRFDSRDRGLEISFRLPAGLQTRGVVIERTLADPIRWGSRHDEPLHPDSLGQVVFLDTGVEAGREYRYRFRTLFDPEGLVVFGPYATLYAPPVSPKLALSPARPNPFGARRGEAEFRCDLPEPGRARIDLFDAAGRLVRTLLDADLPAGPRYLLWDGRDDEGRDLPSGSYWVSLRTATGRRGTRVVIVR